MHSDAGRVCLEQEACLLLIHTETVSGVPEASPGPGSKGQGQGHSL